MNPLILLGENRVRRLEAGGGGVETRPILRKINEHVRWMCYWLKDDLI
jgi:hypothetical protein